MLEARHLRFHFGDGEIEFCDRCGVDHGSPPSYCCFALG